MKVSEAEAQTYQVLAVKEKKAILETGGGPTRSFLGDVGAQVVAAMREQMEPLENPFDNENLFFCDVPIIESSKAPSPIPGPSSFHPELHETEPEPVPGPSP